MKKVFATLTVLAMLTFGSAVMMAQEEAAAVEEAAVEQVDEAAPVALEEAEAPAEEAGGLVALHKTLKTKFIEGGAGFMALTLVTLVFGLALCIERIIYLSLSKPRINQLAQKVPMMLMMEVIHTSEVSGCSKLMSSALLYLALAMAPLI